MDLMLDSDVEMEADHSHDEQKFEAYVGAELYNKRMFPSGCPTYQKAFIKLFKSDSQGKLKLIDTKFFTNRDGFGYMLKNLNKGDYQIQFKKYSSGFDVFDFTVRVYANMKVKLIDEDVHHTSKVELTK
jgi:hypothetical protein